MPSHPLNGPDDHIQPLETKELKAGVKTGIKKKCPSSECSKPKTGVHSNPSVTKVGPSLMDEVEESPEGWKQDLPDGWKSNLHEGELDDDTNYSDRLETKLDQLRMKWAGTGYEIIIEKLEMLESWQGDLEEGNEVKESILDWLATNDEDILVEEGEDILDRLEVMEGLGEVSMKLLMDSTELVTSIIVARKLMDGQGMPTFQQDGQRTSPASRNISRKSRASSMIRIRDELMKKKELRKPATSRTVTEKDFDDMKIKRMPRREMSKKAKGLLTSSQVNNSLVQDAGSKIQVVGSDVEALYPSLDAVEVAQIVYNAIMKTEVMFKGINYQEACRMIALTSSEQECRLGPLRRALPIRRYDHGTRPGISGEDPLGPEVGSQDQWKFPNLKRKPLTEQEKKMVVAEVLRKSVLAIFKTHTYRFAEKFYLQRKGGPIGLRSTCCIARITMIWWDRQLLELLRASNISLEECQRYMDDIRLWCYSVRRGWRWKNGELLFQVNGGLRRWKEG